MKASIDVMYEHLAAALLRFFEYEASLVEAAVPLLALNHRLAYYLENEFKSRLFFQDLKVDLAWEPSRAANLVHHAPPSLALHSRKPLSRFLALECRYHVLRAHDKQILLERLSHLDPYRHVAGLCYKPGAPYFLWYLCGKEGISYRRIKKNDVHMARRLTL